MPIISSHVQRSKTKSSSTTPTLEYNSNPNHCLNVKGYSNVCNIENWEKDIHVSFMCANQIFIMFNQNLEMIVCAVWSIIKVPIII